jgi:hypothetical protein
MVKVPRQVETRPRFVGMQVWKVAERWYSTELAGSQCSGREGCTKWYMPYRDIACYVVTAGFVGYIGWDAACLLVCSASRVLTREVQSDTAYGEEELGYLMEMS